MQSKKNLRTWVEIDISALEHNLKQFLKLIRPVGKASGDARPKRTRFMAVVKSNAYGHGLTQVAKQLAGFKIQDSRFRGIWFGVDSITEALRLRKEGIKNPILVLGFTLAAMMQDAAQNNIIISVSNFDSLAGLAAAKEKPLFHLKFDTGMHRQGFLSEEQTLQLIKLIKRHKLSPQGLLTHFAAAKDIAYPTYTLEQLKQFNLIAKQFKRAGFKNIIRHAAASGGTLLFPETHLDMVRVGMGLYGYWPAQEAKIAFSLLANSKFKNKKSKFTLRPALAWKTVVAETKEISNEAYVGYDLTERVSRKTNIAVLPVGYWHGYDRGLSGVGEVLIRGRRRKILGRVSMDMITVDVTDAPRVHTGDEAVLIGKQGGETLWADELALKIGTSPYEFLTRINPLICRFFSKKMNGA